MLGINDRFVRADDRIHVLKKNNPRQNRMRKTGLLRFHVVLPEISRGVKKFLRNNGGFDSHFPFLKPQRLSRRPRFRAFLHHVVKRRPRRIQTAVAILKQPPHAWWNARIRQACNAPSCCTFRRYRAYATFKSTIVSSTSSAPMRSSRLCRLKVTSFMGESASPRNG